jgi:ribosomal protein L11 methyltransferase
MTVGKLAVVAVADAAVAAATAELGALGARAIESRSVGGDRVLVYGRFADDAAARSAVADLRHQGWAAAQRPTDDDPWLTAWRNRTQPIRIGGGRLLVCLPWAELDRGDALVVEIDPGGAFGAGAHPTTHLLLEALAARLRGSETVLDVGCGSGVLAIAAARLGAAAVVGIDLEAAAVVATRANAERNGLASCVTALPTPLHDLPGSFDVIVANIGQETLIALAADLERRLELGGWLGLSGISPAQVSRLAAAFSSIQIVATPQLDDWAALLGAMLPGHLAPPHP